MPWPEPRPAAAAGPGASRPVWAGLGPGFSREPVDDREAEDDEPPPQLQPVQADPQPVQADPPAAPAPASKTSGYYRDGVKYNVKPARSPAEVNADAEAEDLLLVLASGSASGYKGVYVHNKKYWRAQLRRRVGAGKHDNKSLGYGETRSTPIEAALDYARMLRDAEAPWA